MLQDVVKLHFKDNYEPFIHNPIFSSIPTKQYEKLLPLSVIDVAYYSF
jgi:hypothetical protein